MKQFILQGVRKLLTANARFTHTPFAVRRLCGECCGAYPVQEPHA